MKIFIYTIKSLNRGFPLIQMREKIRNFLVISICSIIIMSCSTPGQVAQESENRFYSLTSEFIENCTSVTGLGDPLETIITFNTINCYKAEGGILRLTWNDQFLRGYVSKSSKSVMSLQVYSIIYSQQGRWIYPYQGNYLIDGELLTDDGTSISSDVDCSMSSTYGSCRYRDDYGFDLDLRVFDEARRLKALGEQTFNYRIKTRAGGDINRIFNVEEILGLENKMKSVLSSL